MERFLTLDQSVFLLINHLPHPTVINFIAQFVSAVGTVGIIWFALGVLLFIREEKKDLSRRQAGRKFVRQLVLIGVSTFILVELLLKPFIGRLRPVAEMGAIIIGNNDVYTFSFPSGHAAISFAAAIVLSKKEPKWRWLFYLLAVLISLSRIYLGKHYPFDVVIGAVIGWTIGKGIPYLSDTVIFIRKH